MGPRKESDRKRQLINCGWKTLSVAPEHIKPCMICEGRAESDLSVGEYQCMEFVDIESECARAREAFK